MRGSAVGREGRGPGGALQLGKVGALGIHCRALCTGISLFRDCGTALRAACRIQETVCFIAVWL